MILFDEISVLLLPILIEAFTLISVFKFVVLKIDNKANAVD